MENNKDIEYYTSKNTAFPFILRGLSLILIIIALIYFELNPNLFLTIIIMLLIFFIVIPTEHIYIYKDHFEVISKKAIPFIKSVKQYHFNEINKILIHKSKWTLLWGIEPFIPMKEGKKIEIEFKNGDLKVIENLHIKKDELDKCIKLIQEKTRNK